MLLSANWSWAISGPKSTETSAVTGPRSGLTHDVRGFLLFRRVSAGVSCRLPAREVAPQLTGALGRQHPARGFASRRLAGRLLGTGHPSTRQGQS